jgi:hypothetical protein
MNVCYILEMESFCATSGSAETEHTFDVFPTLENAKKEMQKRAKKRLSNLPGWEKSFECETKIVLTCESMFFDKHVTWTIYQGNNH